MTQVQEKLGKIQRLLYEVRREVAEAELRQAKELAAAQDLSLDGRLAVESYQSRGPGV